jgi:hypothetical protein
MAKIREIDLPDQLLQAIQKRAAAQGITVEQRVVQDLAMAEAGEEDLSEQELLVAIRRERQALAEKGIGLTPDELTEAKNWRRK